MKRRYDISGGYALIIAALCLALAAPSLAVQNSADAFMSLPFGHPFKRTQLRMERSGATVLTPREESLTMEGWFEGRPAVFSFGFHRKKGLNAKGVYIQSTGDGKKDEQFYRLLKRGYEARFGSGRETAVPNTWKEGRIMDQCAWTPDRWTTITLTYNAEVRERFPGRSMKDRPIHLLYSYSKWDEVK